MSLCRCYRNGAFPDGDLSDFFTPDEDERFICAICYRPLHHATLVRLRRHQTELERTIYDCNDDGKPADWCRACRLPHRWIR